MTMIPSPQDLPLSPTGEAPAKTGLGATPAADRSTPSPRRRLAGVGRLTATPVLVAPVLVAPATFAAVVVATVLAATVLATLTAAPLRAEDPAPGVATTIAATEPAEAGASAGADGGLDVLPGELPIDLPAALALAAERSPDLAAARAVAEAARLRAVAARRTHLPRVGLEVGVDAADRPSMVFANRLDAGDFATEDFGLDRLNDPNFLVHGALAVSAELPLDLFGQLRAAADAADAAASVPAAEVAVAAAELARAVAEAWSQAALADQLVTVARTAHAAAEARERDFAARVEEGALLNAELLRVRAARRAREADLVARSSERDAARAILSRLLAAPADQLYVPTTASTAAPPPLEPLASAQAAAAAQRPELAAATARIAAARLGHEVLRRERLPQTGLWGSVRDDRLDLSTDRQSAAVGVSLRWSLFDPTRDTRTAAAGAQVAAAEAAATATRDQVRLEVTRAWQAAAAARARLAAAAGGTSEGREALRVVRERREAGLATLTDELETESMALGAELAERAAATVVHIADAALARAIGTPVAGSAIPPVPTAATADEAGRVPTAGAAAAAGSDDATVGTAGTAAAPANQPITNPEAGR